MKKALLILTFIIAAVAFTSCKSQKSGCGLTGSVDTQTLITTEYQA